MTSHLDYYNSLLFGVPKYQRDHLQRVVNDAARLIFRIPKFDHTLSTLSHLHWLPVTYHIHFKLVLLVYKSLNNQGPQYIQNICSHTPFLVIKYIPVNRAFLRPQELILRPLVIAPSPVLGHSCGTNCCLKFKTVRV